MERQSRRAPWGTHEREWEKSCSRQDLISPQYIDSLTTIIYMFGKHKHDGCEQCKQERGEYGAMTKEKKVEFFEGKIAKLQKKVEAIKAGKNVEDKE